MSSNNPSPPAGLSRNPSSDHETQLPRGECGFILPGVDPEGGRKRCCCRSFYPDQVVRSQCGCGHQAWHHEAQPLATVSAEQYLAVTKELQALKQQVRRYDYLERELARERAIREERDRIWRTLEQRIYESMKLLKVSMDDKVEAVIDKTQENHDAIKNLQNKMMIVDDSTMDIETRVEKLEKDRGWRSRSLTPVLEASPEQPNMRLPIRVEKPNLPQEWQTKVIMVPSRSQRYAFEPDSVGYKRCKSRNLHQDLHFYGADSSTFIHGIEVAFKGLLRGRPWIPLVGYRPADDPFGRIVLRPLADADCFKDRWDQAFLDYHCIAHDKLQGNLLFIALQHEELSWHEIRFLPAVPGTDQSCWAHHDELDGKQGLYKSLDSELMYDDTAEPPPYSSQHHQQQLQQQQQQHQQHNAHAGSHDRMLPRPRSLVAQTPLEVLAASASALVPMASARTKTSAAVSERSLPLTDTSYDLDPGSDDEHREKRPKLRPKQSLPAVTAGTSAPMSAPATPTTTTTVYVSGRSKRKMPLKAKDPVRFNVTEWRPSTLLHRNHNKDRAAGAAT